MSDPSADKPTTLNQSGGVTINAETVNITGDVIGRDGINAGVGGSTPSAGSSAQPAPAATPPLELVIRFSAPASKSSKRLRYSVHVEQLNLHTSDLNFAIPLDDKTLAELHWYLEVYPRWPVGPDYDRALKVEASLAEWGTQLFNAVFAKSSAMRVYEQFRLRNTESRTVTVDAVDANVLRLPWELLADRGTHLFSEIPPISVRRKLRTDKELRPRTFSLPVRILMVISRPEDEDVGFLDPRSSASALLDAIEPMGNLVAVEFLYPPTLEALKNRLRDTSFPQVHVVHFDGHGVYVSETGLGYLLFENDDHAEDLVNANQIGTLLNNTGVPLIILDACQTAKFDKANPFGTVAARLLESGAGSVLAMNYSVMVTATRILTATFYTTLSKGGTIAQAVDEARLQMLSKTSRFDLYRNGKEETIRLYDWFVPALYQQSLDPAPFTGTSPLSATGERLGVGVSVPTYPARGGFPEEPRYGFHGRERELLHLRRTLAERPIVVVHGYGGQGKTSLAAHAARWFTRTHLFERAIFVSFERGGGLDYALSEMGAALLGDNFAIHQGDPIDAIAAALRDTPTLVVWDNFESILPNGDAYASDQELQKLLSAAARWFSPSPVGRGVGGEGSRLIVTTRDTNLPNPSFSPGRTAAHTELPGLGLLDALDLAAQILKDNGIARPPRQGLANLLSQLGGHPLSIQLVVPQLRTYTPDKLIAEFDALLPGFTTGAGQERNESLRVSLDFSLRRLGEATRNMLPALAVFQGRAMEDDLLEITGFPPDAWAKARTELTSAGLATLEPLPNIQFPYIHFHPTLLPYLSRQLDAHKRQELEERYRQRYHAVANYCYQEDNQNPMMARAIVMRELPNFRRALDLTLAAGDTDAAADFADSIAKFLDIFGRWSERDAMMGEVEKAIREQGAGSREKTIRQSEINNQQSNAVTQAEYLMATQQGERLLQQGRAVQAERVFRDLLARLGDEPSYKRATTLAFLGRCLEAQGKQSAAAEMQRQHLATLAQLEQTVDIKRQTGAAHTDLADVLAEMGQFDAARREYETAKVIMQEIDDSSVSTILGQLGTLALKQNNLTEARQRYMEALVIRQREGNLQSQGIWWHQLGRVAQEAKDWPEAERCYKESLGIKERLGDKALAATTCNQLANVAKGANRPDEAERWYKRAIDYAELLSDQGAGVFSNLANLYLSQGRLDEAEQFAHRAREIRETLDLSSEPWKTYNILAQIADKRGRVQEARQWQKKATDTRRAFDERAGYQAYAKILQQFDGVINGVIAAVNGDANARAQVEARFDSFKKGNWQIVDAIQRIWAGERDAEALTESIDANSAAIVVRILQLLAQPSPQPSPTGEGADTSPVGEVDEPSGESGEGESEQDGVSLQDILNLVIVGAQGNAQAGQQAYQITQALQQPGMPPEYHAIGKGLQNVLEGLRGEEAVRGLPPEAAQIVQVVLQQIGNE